MEKNKIYMKIPGFTADASLGKANMGYLRVATSRSSTRSGEVVPQQTHAYCFYGGHYAGYICCICTPQDGCTCRSPGETQF
jgi:hypothetical protein